MCGKLRRRSQYCFVRDVFCWKCELFILPVPAKCHLLLIEKIEISQQQNYAVVWCLFAWLHFNPSMLFFFARLYFFFEVITPRVASIWIESQYFHIINRKLFQGEINQLNAYTVFTMFGYFCYFFFWILYMFSLH